MGRKAIFLSVAAATVLMVSGCGGGSGEKKSAPGESSGSGIGINVRGGAGEIDGTAGGYFSINSGVTLKITKSGTADTSFRVPTHTADLGSIPAVIHEDTVIPIYRGDENQMIGVPYYYRNEKLMVNAGEDANTSNDRNATGLQIDQGVTVLAEGDDFTQYSFVSDVVIDGVLRVARRDEEGNLSPENTPGDLMISTESGWIVVGEEGKIDLGSRSEDAGHLALRILDPDVPESGEHVAVVIAGTIDTQGIHDDETDIRILTESQAAIYIAQRAKLQADGVGSHSGGDIQIYSYGGLYSAGTLSVEGGEVAGHAGSGGQIVLTGRGGYPFLLSGRLTASGGAGLENNVSGGTSVSPDAGSGTSDGGDGGTIALNFRSDKYFRSSAEIEVNGGDAPEGIAGKGGEVELNVFAEGSERNIAQISGPLSASGGDGRVGGSGGDISFDLYVVNADDRTETPNATLMGYSYIAANGGAGVDVQGRIGDDSGEIDFYFGDGRYDAVDALEFLNESDLYVYGGDAKEPESPEEISGGEGGNGGRLTVYSEVQISVANSGNIYLYGGDSWGDADNSDGGRLSYCFQEGVDGNFTAGVEVNLSPGTGGSGADGAAGRIVEECD